VWVNGEPAAAHAQVGTSGSYYRLRVTFGSSTARRIRVEGQYVSFCGIAKRVTRTIWATVRDTGPICVGVVDSYGANWDGATASTLWIWDSYMVRAGRYLGWDVYPSGVGGTGFTATNGGANVKFGSRLTSDVVNLAPEIVLVAGSVNDNSQTLATVQSDISSYFSTLRAALPSATVYAIGGVTPLDSKTNMGTISGYISTAAAANSCTFVDSVDWINGTGYNGTGSQDGNSYYYTAADGVHLLAAGYSYITERLVGAIGSTVGRRA
jgi:lysophospholipase L1-like esterase